jgi:hypothetical protein
MCFAWISEQTAIISLYDINWLLFITEAESVYCAVRTGYLNQTVIDSPLKGQYSFKEMSQLTYNNASPLLFEIIGIGIFKNSFQKTKHIFFGVFKAIFIVAPCSLEIH